MTLLLAAVADNTALLTAIAASASLLAAAATARDAVRRRRDSKSVRVELDQALATSERLMRALMSRDDLAGVQLVGLNFEGAVLREKDLHGANLSRCVLSGADLSGADLSRAQLRHSDLTFARGRNANLSESDLGSSDLAGGDFAGAIFARANLRDANLIGTNLTRADFRDALLADADLRGAELEGASFAGADLVGAKLPTGVGLEPAGRGHRGETSAVIRPVYLVIDTSYSLAGGPIEALNAQLHESLLTLQADGSVAQSTWLAVMSFDTDARLVVPLTAVADIPAVPHLPARGTTAYRPAFALLSEQIAVDMARLNKQGHEVLRPAVWFITDGSPVDSGWREVRSTLVAEDNPYRPEIVALGVGDVQPSIIASVATRLALVADESASLVEAIRAFGAALTSSVGSDRHEGVPTAVPQGFTEVVRPQ